MKLKSIPNPLRRVTQRIGDIRQWWKQLPQVQKRGVRMLLYIVTLIVGFLFSLRALPPYVPNTTISAITVLYVLVGIGLLALLPQIRDHFTRFWAASITILSLILSLMTFVYSNIQTGFKVSSTDWVTIDFQLATGMLMVAIEIAAIGLLVFPDSMRQASPTTQLDYWKRFN